MDTEFDPIRIFWIDDCEGQDAGYMYPERTLPTEELRRYFTIVKHPDIPGPSTIRTSQDFGTCFSPFWWGNAETNLLPPEIIGMDYNLQKWIDAKARLTKQKTRSRSYMAGGAYATTTASVEVESADVHVEDKKWTAGFEGLVLGIFTSSLLYQHPIGIVPMTNYGDLLESIPEVRALHLISKEILHIDYSEFGVSGEDRSWEKVLKKGVKALRVRIADLYESGQIVLSPSDLMALADDAAHRVLTLRSPHAVRRLPIQGLFIDEPEEKRTGAIQKWARDLMRTVMVDCEELRQAQELAGEVWKAYNNNKLVEDRKNLSLLACRKEAGAEIDPGEYNRLCDIFGVDKKKAKSSCVDIMSTGDYSDRVRRWAALFITRNMLKKLIQIRKQVDALCISDFVNDDHYVNIDRTGPVLIADDLFLALFPAAEGAIILPWHSEPRLSNTAATWPTNMLDWRTKGYQGKKREGNLALSVYDLLAGKGWKPEHEGPHGLTDSERLVLRGFALEDKDLTEADWRACTRANLVLWGSQQEVGHE